MGQSQFAIILEPKQMLIEIDRIQLLLKSDSHYYPTKDHEEVERAPAGHTRNSR